MRINTYLEGKSYVLGQLFADQLLLLRFDVSLFISVILPTLFKNLLDQL